MSTPTPITDDASLHTDAFESPAKAREFARRLELDRSALMKAVDILTLVIGLTPVKGNLEALQEAYDQARTALSTARANFPEA